MSAQGLISLENTWKTHTNAGNNQFRTGCFMKALLFYEKALEIAKLINQHKEKCTKVSIPYIQIFVISCNNMANTYEELCKPEKTEKLLKRVVYFLLTLSEQGLVSSEVLHNEMRLSMINFTDYVKRNGLNQEETERLLLNIKNEVKLGGNLN
ncbi:hypothetical protein [Cyclobacterium marinum]|uniref:Tetratricopeptide TPR_1 repeat-containing protein n=1 Tax=Cyclobacterium marinum (strain ATCC 25205 / DSM 745 / LMG 13164 / NCIMB 1802) TaxID=880070 RepID=G0J0Y7_CYCMS|nr:hypothetical protein [Cyclobacterium marinum]AEL25113.1 hypothetical protein Cycma_1342 [Cyclobacterium marinum DSM 745]